MQAEQLESSEEKLRHAVAALLHHASDMIAPLDADVEQIKARVATPAERREAAHLLLHASGSALQA